MARFLVSRRALMIAGAVSFALALPSTVAADTGTGAIDPAWSNGATVSVVSASFDNKLVATVTIEVTCAPFELIDPYTGEPTGPTTQPGQLYGNVLLMQAQGRSIAHASGMLRAGDSGGMYEGLPVECDGVTAYRFDVPVIAQDLPLKRGAAIVGVVVQMSAVDQAPCCGWWGGNNASSGAVSVKLR